MTDGLGPPADTDAGHPPPAEPSTLWNRHFVLLWQGQLVSQMGNQAYLVALMFWTLEATGSASVMGLLLMTSALPGVLVGPIAGTLADRHSRKTIIVVSDIARGVATVLVAALIWWQEATAPVIAGLFVLSLFSGVVGALFRPAISAAIPDLVSRDRVQAANSLNQTSIQGAAMFGQAVGGVLYRVLGAPLLFLIDGISYLVSAASESFIRIPQEIPIRSAGVRQALSDYLAATRIGLRYVWERRGLRAFILTAAALNFFFMPIFVLLPFYVTTRLSQGAEWYGLLLAAMSAGSLAGIAFAGFVSRGTARGRPLIPALIGVSVLMATLGLVSHPGLALAWTFGLGALTGMINVVVISQVQLTTPAELRGRVLALLFALTGAATPIGMALGGVGGDLVGRDVPLVYTTVGVMAAIVVLAAVSRPAFRRFVVAESEETEPRTGTESQ